MVGRIRMCSTVSFPTFQSCRLFTTRSAAMPAETIEIAGLLRRTSAYDAAYLALSERLRMPLITLDRALRRNAASLGFDVRAVL
jgi:predicted nucleic acid-binding protein